MLKEDSETLVGNDRYEGFNVDLIEEISQILGFNYTIKLVADWNYGSYDKVKGEWSGMIGELQSQKADLVVADITITYEREQGVDFTMPFMNLGVTILYKKQQRKIQTCFPSFHRFPLMFGFTSSQLIWPYLYFFLQYQGKYLKYITYLLNSLFLGSVHLKSQWHKMKQNFLLIMQV